MNLSSSTGLRIHGIALLIISLVATANTLYSHITGDGPYGFVHGNPMVSVGLVQAYLLMALIAAILWHIAARQPARPWHIIAALAHVAPLSVVLAFLDVLRAQGFMPIAALSLALHFFWICFEIIFSVRGAYGAAGRMSVKEQTSR